MKKSKRHNICLFTALPLLVSLLNQVSGQSYINGSMGVFGNSYNMATYIGPAGNVVVGANGNWVLGGTVTSSPRSISNGISFSNLGTVSGSSSTNYLDGFAKQTGATAFNFPMGDATYDEAYHPLSITAPSASTTITTSYVASTATPNSNNVNSLSLDKTSYWTFGSTTPGATSTITLATRDETGVFSGGSKIAVAGYNNTTSQWEVVGTPTPILAGGQNIVSNNIDVSKYTAFTVATSTNAVLISLKVFLQGAFPLPSIISGTSTYAAYPNNISQMSTKLSIANLALIPKAQPYNVAFGQLSAYLGTESVPSIPTNMTDWVLVELRNATNPSVVIATRAAILLNNGNVVDTTAGFASPLYFPVAAGNYFVAIRHRNHLGIRSSSALNLSSTAIAYDFSLAQNNAYQNPALIVSAANPSGNAAMAQLGNVYAMWAGNANGDSRVSLNGINNDLTSIGTYLTNLGLPTIGRVYSPFDINLDGKVALTGLNNDLLFIEYMTGQNSNVIIRQHL